MSTPSSSRRAPGGAGESRAAGAGACSCPNAGRADDAHGLTRQHPQREIHQCRLARLPARVGEGNALEVERPAHVGEAALALQVFHVGAGQHLVQATQAFQPPRHHGKCVQEPGQHGGQHGEITADEHHVARRQRQNAPVAEPGGEDQSQQPELGENDPGGGVAFPVLPVQPQPGGLHPAQMPLGPGKFVLLDGVRARDRDHVEHPAQAGGQPLGFPPEDVAGFAQTFAQQMVQASGYRSGQQQDRHKRRGTAGNRPRG